jgi:O-antigen/teichoic acid export membrane protein
VSDSTTQKLDNTNETATAERVARNRRMIGGSVASATNVILFIIYQLVSLPVFLTSYGERRYSDWLILYGMPALLSVSDLGVPDVVGSQMTMLRSAGCVSEAALLYRRVRQLARYWLAALAAALLVITWCLNPDTFLHLHTLTPHEARVALTALIGWLCINLYWGLYSAGYQSSKLFPRNLSIIAMTRAAESAVIIGSVAMGFSIPALAIALLATRVVASALMARDFSRRTVWAKSPMPDKFSTERPSLRRLVSPAIASLAFPAGTTVQNQGMLLVVNWRAGAGAVVIVNTIRTVTNSLYQFNTFIKAGVTPELSDRFGVSDTVAVREIAVKVTSLITAFNVALGLLIAFIGPWFLILWSGGRVRVSIAVMTLFAVCSATDCVWHSMSNVAQAKNVHQRIALAYFLACLIALPLSFWLLPSLGVAAVAWSLFSTSIIVNIVTVRSICRLLEVTAVEYAVTSSRFLISVLKQNPMHWLRRLRSA